MDLKEILWKMWAKIIWLRIWAILSFCKLGDEHSCPVEEVDDLMASLMTVSFSRETLVLWVFG
jgi:hypothetical protein